MYATAAKTHAHAEALARVAAGADSALPLPRALLLFAHPDDEVLALGARLERFRASALRCATDGAPPDGADARAHGFATLAAYRARRRAELEAALELATVPLANARALELPGCGTIPDQQATLHLPALARQIVREIEACKPEAILTHPFEGGHPDHDSCAFAVHAARELLGAGDTLAVIEAPFYHAGPQGIETGCFLPGRASAPPVVHRLSPSERERKAERLRCFRTQAETLAQFGLEDEQFRLAPAYDFEAAPHPGALFYERFAWGMTGARFRELAGAARRELGLPAP